MNNLEKYRSIFAEVFGVEEAVITDDFSKETTESWDSVHQLNTIALLEETFDILLDPEDIMEFTSFAAGKEILSKNGVMFH